MKKKFLIKSGIVFFVFVFSFLLQWKITFGKSVCKMSLQKISEEKCFAQPQPLETGNNSYGTYPFEDFLIKI